MFQGRMGEDVRKRIGKSNLCIFLFAEVSETTKMSNSSMFSAIRLVLMWGSVQNLFEHPPPFWDYG